MADDHMNMPAEHEIPQIIFAIRNEVASMKMMMQMHSMRIDQMETLLKEHREQCQKNNEDMKAILELVEAIRQGMKITNFLRNAFVWVAGLVTAGLTLWQHFKQ